MIFYKCDDININDLMPSVKEIVFAVDDKIAKSNFAINRYIEKYLFWINILHFGDENSFLIESIYILIENINEHVFIRNDLKKINTYYKRNKLKLQNLLNQNINYSNFENNKMIENWIFCQLSYKNYEKAVISNRLNILFQNFFSKASDIFNQIIICSKKTINNKLNYDNSIVIDHLFKEILVLISDFEINYKIISNKYFQDFHNVVFCQIEYEYFQNFIRIFINLLWSKINQLLSIIAEQRIFIFTTLKYYLSFMGLKIESYSILLDLLNEIVQVKSNYHESFLLEFNKNPEEVEKNNQVLIAKLKNIYNNQSEIIENKDLNSMMNILMFIVFIYLKTNVVLAKFNKYLYDVIFYIK